MEATTYSEAFVTGEILFIAVGSAGIIATMLGLLYGLCSALYQATRLVGGEKDPAVPARQQDWAANGVYCRYLACGQGGDGARDTASDAASDATSDTASNLTDDSAASPTGNNLGGQAQGETPVTRVVNRLPLRRRSARHVDK